MQAARQAFVDNSLSKTVNFPNTATADDVAVFRQALPQAQIVRVSGKDLFWYGAWTLDALPRLAVQLAGLNN